MEYRSKKTIQKISKLGKIIMIAALGLTCLCIALFCIAAIIIVFMPDTLPSDTSYSETVYRLIVGSFGCAVLAIIFYLLAKLTENLSNQPTPFIRDNVKIMKRIALVLLIGFVLDAVTHLVTGFALDIDMSTYSIDLSSLVFAGIVYFLSLIFQYGVELQEESDSFV